MFSAFDFDVIQRALPYLWQGMMTTLGLTLLAMVGGIVLGTLLALMRLSSIKAISVPAGIYVNLAAKNKNFSVEAGLKNLEMISKRFFREKASKKVDV